MEGGEVGDPHLGVLGQQPGPHRGVAQRGHALGEGQRVQRAVARAAQQRMSGDAQAEQHTDGAHANLGAGGGAGGVPLGDAGQQLAEAVRRAVVLLHREAHGPAELEGDALQQRQFGGDQFVVGRLVGVGDELHHARAGPAQRRGDAEDLVGRRVERADLLAQARAVHPRARCGETEGTGSHRRLGQCRHGGDLVGRGDLAVVGPPLTHHVGAQRGVGHLGADVERPAHAVEHVEVLLEALPPPRHPLVEGGAGDVFDAFEERDEPAVLVGPGRGEAHAAVAHEQRGDAVGGRWRHVGVPRGLAVVVGVDVDPARCDQHAVGVDGAVGGAHVVTHRHDAPVGDRKVGSARRSARTVDHGAVPDDEIGHRCPQ